MSIMAEWERKTKDEVFYDTRKNEEKVSPSFITREAFAGG